MKKYVLIISALGLLGLITWFCFNFGLPWNYVAAKSDFVEHLNQYEKEMVLEDLQYDIIHRKYTGLAYVVNNPDLHFYIGQSLNTGEIEDGYEFVQTEMDARIAVKTILDKYIQARSSLGVELVSLGNRELEINVATKQQVSDEMKEKIRHALVEKGLHTDQLFFNRN